MAFQQSFRDVNSQLEQNVKPHQPRQFVPPEPAVPVHSFCQVSGYENKAGHVEGVDQIQTVGGKAGAGHRQQKMADHHQDDQYPLCVVNSVISFSHGSLLSSRQQAAIPPAAVHQKETPPAGEIFSGCSASRTYAVIISAFTSVCPPWPSRHLPALRISSVHPLRRFPLRHSRI